MKTYEVTWYRCPHGIEGEAMLAQWKEFSTLKAAINFAKNKCCNTKRKYFAGVTVQANNGTGKWWRPLYEISSEGEEFCYGRRCQ